MTRTIKPTIYRFCASQDIADEKIASVEGVQEHGDLRVKVLHVGKDILMLEVFRGKGQVDPPHLHEDHESCGYLVQGRMKVVIGDTEFIAEAGASWRHPAGVLHSSEALTDCVQIEVKSPPRKTWTSN